MIVARRIGFGLGAAVLLAALGITLGLIVARVNQSSADTMTLRSSVLQVSGDQLGLWHDEVKTDTVTSLQFTKLRIQPPLRPIGPNMSQATVFIENRTTGDLYLTGPCGTVESPLGTVIGTMDAVVHTLGDVLLGNTCDVPATVIVSSGDLVRAVLRIELAPGLASGDYPFQTMFEVVSHVAVPPPAGMVSWWPGDGHGNDILDANDGTLVGGAGFVPGLVRQAFSFDAGLNSGVIVANGANLNMTEAITLDAWVKPSSFPNSFPTVVRKHADAAGNTQYILAVTDQGQVHCNIGDFVGPVGGTVALNKWTHLACVYDRVVARVYVDGEEVGAAPATQPIPASSMPLGIGRAEPFTIRNFDGLIDEVEIFNRALAAEEIRAIYEAGSAGKTKPEPPPPGEPLPPPGGLVSWWPGDGDAGDIIDANDGTLAGGAGFAPGMVGQAFSFDAGLDSGVTVPNGGNLNMTEAITLDAWVRPSSFPNSFPTVVRKHTDAGGVQYILAVTDQGQAHCHIGGFVNLTGGTVVLNGWTHLACVYDRVGLRVYVNGGQVAAAPATQPIPASSMPLGIGRSESLTTRNFDGVIDEVEIFDRALRGEEIRAIYNAGSAGKIKPSPPPPPEPIPPPAGMVSWWPGDGNANDIVDGNDGTLSGDATFTPGMVEEAFNLDGTGDFVVVPDSPNLNITSDVTVDLWAKRTVFDGSSPVMIEKGAGAIGVVDAPDLYFLSFDSTDHLNGGFERADGSNVILIGPTVTDTNFHHYAYVRSGDTHKLFMDGVMVTGDTFTGSPGDTSGIELAIGALRHDAFPGGFCCHFGGVIDEVELFNRALTADEIRSIYEAGSAGKIKPEPEPIPPPAGMVGWWPGDGNAKDIVDGNPGTLQGGVTFAPGLVDQAFSFDGASGTNVSIPRQR